MYVKLGGRPRWVALLVMMGGGLQLASCDETPTAHLTDGGNSIDGGTHAVDGGGSGPGVDGSRGDSGVSGGDGSTPRPDQGASGACTVFPPDNPWNTDISGYPVHPNSAAFVSSIGGGTPLHPDFGKGDNGIPFMLIDSSGPLVDINFTESSDESEPGPYPIPLDAPTETNSSDRHAIAVDLQGCMLYELFSATPRPAQNRWDAASGAKFDLRSNKLRPIGWTSADAAGLPIYPGLVRYEEVQAGAINHALRFTVEKSRKAYVLPATHYASSNTGASLPAMGLRFRLKASVDISSLSKSNQVILTALKKYGMFVADNGGDWFLSGAPNPKWDDDDLHQLQVKIKGSDFEVVDTGPINTSY